MHYEPSYLIQLSQGLRRKPKKYRHYVEFPVILFDELVYNKVIEPDYLHIEEIAFFEFSGELVKISFITYSHVEDVHIRILSYLVKKSSGADPIRRGGSFGI